MLWLLAGAVGAAAAVASHKAGQNTGGGNAGGGDVEISDCAIRVRCGVCSIIEVAYVHRETSWPFGTSVWIRMPEKWTYPLQEGNRGALRGPLSLDGSAIAIALGKDSASSGYVAIPASTPLDVAADPVVCRCKKHGFATEGTPPEDVDPRGQTPASIERERQYIANRLPPVTLEALHAYDITAEVVDASDLEALKLAVFPMLGFALAGPMSAAVVGLGRIWRQRATVRVRLGINILVGGHTVKLEKEYARENIGAIWFQEITDKGLFGMGG
jgi:hypothetical protein